MPVLNVTPSALHFPPKKPERATACAFIARSTVKGMLMYFVSASNLNLKARICAGAGILSAVRSSSRVWGG